MRQIARDLKVGQTCSSVKCQDVTQKVIQNGNDPTVPVFEVLVEVNAEKKESSFYKDDEYDFAIIDEDIE